MECKQGILKQHSSFPPKLLFLEQKVQSYLDSRDSIQLYHKEHSFAYRHVKLIVVVHKVYCKTHRSPKFKTPDKAVTRSHLHHGVALPLPGPTALGTQSHHSQVTGVNKSKDLVVFS